MVEFQGLGFGLYPVQRWVKLTDTIKESVILQGSGCRASGPGEVG